MLSKYYPEITKFYATILNRKTFLYEITRFNFTEIKINTQHLTNKPGSLHKLKLQITHDKNNQSSN